MIITNTPRTSFLNTVHNYHPTSEVIHHPVLGAFSVIQNPQGHKLLKKHLPTLNLDTTEYDRYLTIEYPRILEFKGIMPDTTTSGFSIYSEYFNGTLREEIEQRFLNKTSYTELEILSILQNISSSLSFLQSIKIYHGGIKSSSIVNCNGDYKVLNPALFKASTQEHTKFKPNLPNSKTRIITPEIRNAFYREAIDSVHENYKDDVYGLGLIALDLMTLQVDPSIPIEKRLERSSFSYSSTLVKFVKKMLENVLTLRLDPVACNSYIEQIHLQHGLVSFKRFSRLDKSYIPSQHSERSLPPVKTQNVQMTRGDRGRITESVTPTYRTKPKISSVTIDLSPIEQTSTPPPNQEIVRIQNLKEEESINTSSVSLRQSEPFMRIRETIVYKKIEERPLDDFSSMGKSSISTEMTYTQRNSKMESFIGSNWSLFETPRVSVALRNPNLQSKSGIVDKSPLFESKWTSQNKTGSETDKENSNTSNFQTAPLPPFDYQSPELSKQAHATIKVTSQMPLGADMKKVDTNRIQISTRICPRFFDKEAEKTPKSNHVIQEVSSDLASVGLKEAVSFYVDESTTPLKENSPTSNLLNKNCLDIKETVNHSFTPFTVTFKPNAPLIRQPVETVTVKTYYATPQDSAVAAAMSLYNSQISLRASSISDIRSQSTMVKRVTETMSDGSIYEGDMFGYMKQGRGKLTYPDGKYYEGEWKIGRINGQGTLYNRDGSIIYDGQWKNEKYHGKGVLYNPHKKTCFDEIHSEVLKLKSRGDQTWIKYEGNFQDGMWEGTGDLSFTNGDRYIGDFKKDKIEGRGVFVGINGKIVEGAWKDHCFVESVY